MNSLKLLHLLMNSLSIIIYLEGKMKKGQIIEGYVERTDFPNRGIVVVKEDNKELGVVRKNVQVKGAIKGQKVSFSVKKVRSEKAEGRLLEVIEPSVIEDCKPLCEHFGECGGCTYQTISVENQRKLKEEQVKRLLDSTKQNYEWLGIEGSPIDWEYRNKMEFSFGDEYKGGPLALGMHKKNSFYDIVSITGCKIVNKDYNTILMAVLDYCNKNNYEFYKKMSHEGFLRHLVIRRAMCNGNLMVNLVTSTQNSLDEKEFVDMLLKLELEGEIVSIINTLNDSLADVVQPDKIKILYGEDHIYEQILGLKFKISPFSFFQTNSLGAEVLYSKAREYIGDTNDKVVFDLYSGTGTIAQMIAKVARKVIGVEIVEEAVEAAKINASLNELNNCDFIAGDVLKVLDDIDTKPDTIILDPPRAGVNPKAISKIANYGVEQIVYISCNPVSLVNDLGLFKELGYNLVKAQCVDMFVGNPNVETICLIKKFS